jgi:hypothetical protein
VRKKDFFITNIIKGHKITDLTRPNKLGTMTSKAATKSTGRTWLWKRLRAPSHNTVEDNRLGYTLFSSNEGHSASKTDISSTAGQPRPGKDHIHQSTQARCDPRSDADLHQTVIRQCGRINLKLLDDGTNPTSQDFFHLPPRTT